MVRRRKAVMLRGRDSILVEPGWFHMQMKDGTTRKNAEWDRDALASGQIRIIVHNDAIPMCGGELLFMVAWYQKGNIKIVTDEPINQNWYYELFFDGTVGVSKEGGRNMQEGGYTTPVFFSKVRSWVGRS